MCDTANSAKKHNSQRVLNLTWSCGKTNIARALTRLRHAPLVGVIVLVSAVGVICPRAVVGQEAGVPESPATGSVPSDGVSAAKLPDSQPQPLSVPPESMQIKWRPADGRSTRPEWLNDRLPSDAPHSGADLWRYSYVDTGPCASHSECQVALERAIHDAFLQYIHARFGASSASRWLNRRSEELRSLLASTECYHEVAETAAGTLHRMYARLEFSDDLQQKLQAGWSRMVQVDRLLRVAGYAAVALAAVASSWAGIGLCRQRRHRLRNATLAAGAALLAALAVRWLVWQPFVNGFF